jgi:hypothetical protein
MFSNSKPQPRPQCGPSVKRNCDSASVNKNDNFSLNLELEQPPPSYTEIMEQNQNHPHNGLRNLLERFIPALHREPLEDEEQGLNGHQGEGEGEGGGEEASVWFSFGPSGSRNRFAINASKKPMMALLVILAFLRGQDILQAIPDIMNAVAAIVNAARNHPSGMFLTS